MTASNNTAVVQEDPVDLEQQNKMAVRALILLLITFILGTLCLQGFNLVFTNIGTDVGAPEQAALITSLPSIVLGIVCFIYGSLGDFVSLKKLIVFGLVTLFVGSIFGFIANFFFTKNLWTVIIARILQTAGEQVSGSVYLVIATKYLKKELKVIFFGLFTAGYQVSAAIGVFAAGLLTSISLAVPVPHSGGDDRVPAVPAASAAEPPRRLPACRLARLHHLRPRLGLPFAVLLVQQLVDARGVRRAVRAVRRVH